MLRIEVIELLLKSYTRRELQALAERLGFGVARIAEMPLDLLSDEISNQLFDPGGWHEEFNKLAEMEQ